MASRAHADDHFYAVEAAQKAFPQLPKQFVVIGHSQDGAAASSAVQRQVIIPMEGYLGAVAVSPVMNILKLPSTWPLLGLFVACLSHTLAGLHIDFNPHDILTDDCARGWNLYLHLEAGVGILFELLLSIELLKPDWMTNFYIQDFVKKTLMPTDNGFSSGLDLDHRSSICSCSGPRQGKKVTGELKVRQAKDLRSNNLGAPDLAPSVSKLPS